MDMEEEHHLVDPGDDTDPEDRDGIPNLRIERRTWCSKWGFTVGVVLITAAFIAVAFAAGLLIGMRKLGGSNATPAPCPSPTPATSGFNWGANVKVDGKDTPVVDWLDRNMDASHIKDNL